MQGWHTTFLGMRGLPRDISDFEMKAFLGPVQETDHSVR
jgi:hypothetical protein